MRRLSAKVMAIAVSGLLLAGGEAAAKTPRPYPLPLPSEDATCEAMDINVKGVIVGWCDDVAVRWNRHRRLQVLPSPNGSRCFAAKINAKGRIIGRCHDVGIVLWSPKGVPTIPTPNLQSGDSTGGISNRGEVAGQYGAADPGVFNIKSGEFRQLELPAGVNLEDFAIGVGAINNRGQVAGFTLDISVGGGALDAYIWGKNGVPRRLLPRGESYYDAMVRDVNTKGEAVGPSGLLSNWYEPFATFWEKDGTPRALAPLPGHDRSDANAVNRQGEAVGFSFDTDSTDNFGFHAVLWDRSGTAIELPRLKGHKSAAAEAINDRGEIIGWSSPDGSRNAVPVVWR